MKTTNYAIYRLLTFLGTDKNSFKHAAKIHGDQSDLSKQRYLKMKKNLKMTVLMML